MRLLLASLALLTAVPLAAQAQHAPAAFSFGLKGGATLSNLTNGDRATNRYLWGFHAGATGQVAFSPRFALQVEVLYSQKGDSYEAGGATHTHLRLHYLDVPVLARLRAGHFFAEAGPQLGLLLAARGLVYSVDSGTVGYGPVTDFVNRTELGYVGGLGYQLTHGLGLGLRYNGGLRPTLNISTYGPTQRNNAFQLYASYQFGK